MTSGRYRGTCLVIKFLFHENALNLLINISLKFKYFVISFSGSYCDPSSSVFTCDDGHCIPHSFRCDGYHDCWTNEDENDGCLSNVGEYYSMLIMFSGKKTYRQTTVRTRCRKVMASLPQIYFCRHVLSI